MTEQQDATMRADIRKATMCFTWKRMILGEAINDHFEFCHYSLTCKPEYYGSTVPLTRTAIQDQIPFFGQAQRSGKSKGFGKGKPAKPKAKKESAPKHARHLCK